MNLLKSVLIVLLIVGYVLNLIGFLYFNFQSKGIGFLLTTVLIFSIPFGASYLGLANFGTGWASLILRGVLIVGLGAYCMGLIWVDASASGHPVVFALLIPFIMVAAFEGIHFVIRTLL